MRIADRFPDIHNIILPSIPSRFDQHAPVLGKFLGFNTPNASKGPIVEGETAIGLIGDGPLVAIEFTVIDPLEGLAVESTCYRTNPFTTLRISDGTPDRVILFGQDNEPVSHMMDQTTQLTVIDLFASKARKKMEAEFWGSGRIVKSARSRVPGPSQLHIDPAATKS